MSVDSCAKMVELMNERKQEAFSEQWQRHEQVGAVCLDVGRYYKIVARKDIIQKLPQLHAVPQCHKRVVGYIFEFQHSVPEVCKLCPGDENVAEFVHLHGLQIL